MCRNDSEKRGNTALMMGICIFDGETVFFRKFCLEMQRKFGIILCCMIFLKNTSGRVIYVKSWI